MSKDEKIRKEIILKERYRVLSELESELPRNSKTKIARKIDKLMREAITELAALI